jgi:flagella basal body P-ring formation protein FlgA
VTKVRVPAQIKLVGISETISAEQQLKAIRAFSERRLGKRGRITELRAHQNLSDVKVPPGSRIARLSPVGGNPFARRVTYKLEIERRGRLVNTRYPQVEVVGKALVFVAARNLPAKHLITASDLHREERDLSQIPKGSLGRFPMIGMLTARRISSGRTLRRNYFKSPPVVRRGQRIRIELRGAMLSVSTAGEALGEAAVGQTVAVRNLNSGRRLSGVVRAPGLVEVTP